MAITALTLGNIKFIRELFKLKMLTEAIMHDCVVKLLKNHDEGRSLNAFVVCSPPLAKTWTLRRPR